MAIFAIGDIHGCYHEFKALLKKIKFSPNHDHLYLVGDLINRGTESRAVLDLVLDLDNHCHSILGNHEFAFLVYNEGLISLKKGDSYHTLLNNTETDHYLKYLANLPLMHYLPDYNTAICHAGLAPSWSIKHAEMLSNEIHEQLIHHESRTTLLNTLFGNTPAQWNDALTGQDRYRCIVNYFTRMRYLHKDESLDFNCKLPIKDAPKEMYPWFITKRLHQDTRLIFGHWAALGLYQSHNTICIDTGVCWGEALTAVRLDTPEPFFFHIESLQK